MPLINPAASRGIDYMLDGSNPLVVIVDVPDMATTDATL